MRFKDLDIRSINISKSLENSLDIFFYENNIYKIQDIFSKKHKFGSTRNVGKIRIKEFNDFINKLNELQESHIGENENSKIDQIKDFTEYEISVILSYVEKHNSTRLYNILFNLFKTEKIKNITEFEKIKINFKKIRNSGIKTAQEILDININNILLDHTPEIINNYSKSSIDDCVIILKTHGSQRIRNRILDIENTITTSNPSNFKENLKSIRGLGYGSIEEITNLISDNENKIQFNNNEIQINKSILYTHFPQIANYGQDEVNDKESLKYILATIKNNNTKWNFNEKKIVARELCNYFQFNNHLTHENLVSHHFSIKIFSLFWAFPSQIHYFIYVILFNDPYESITRERKRQILSKRSQEKPYDIYKLSFDASENHPLINNKSIPQNHLFTVHIFGEKLFILNKKLNNDIKLLKTRQKLNRINIINYQINETTLNNYLELFYSNQLQYGDNHITNIKTNNRNLENQKLRKRIENFVEINQHLGITSGMIAKELSLYGRTINKLQIPNWIRNEKLNLAQKLDWTWVIFNGKFHRDIPYKTFTEYFKTAIYKLTDLFEIINYLRIYYTNYRIHNFYSLMRIDKVTYIYFKNNYILGLSVSDANTDSIKTLDTALRNPCQENLEILQNSPSHKILEQWFSRFTIFKLNSKTYYLSHIQNDGDYIDQTDFFKNNYRQENIIFLLNDIYFNFHGKKLINIQ